MHVNNSTTEYQPLTFDAIRIGLASPDKILEWSHGEVKKPETINYRTLKPETDGLLCERIFGPSKDWECHCGKYKKIRYKGVICDRCGVEVTKASVRRERMGHITLAAPVSHIWYFKSIPSHMGLILDISPRNLEKVLYFANYIVLDPKETDLSYKQILTDREYRDAQAQYGLDSFRAGMGAESILELLKAIDLDKESDELHSDLEVSSGAKRDKIIQRLGAVEAFRCSGNKPEWMIMTVIPVIPADIRPMVQLNDGKFATSDLNDLYRRIINRNNRLARLIELDAPEIIIRNETRELQKAVDALIDNGRCDIPTKNSVNRTLKSLSDNLKGKQGRFRQNLLGKRVDYSGRSVIVVGPELKIYQCGLPKTMALELFKPFVMKELVGRGNAHSIKAAKKMAEKALLDIAMPNVWDVLEDVIKEHPVMLNHAPALHRLGIQAFEPILVDGKAIKLHPLVCNAFNAKLDDDQMAVHLPLSAEAQAECRFLLLSPNNLLNPENGSLLTVPSQDMVLGIYYLTQIRPGAKGEGKVFRSPNEALLALENKVITLHSLIRVRVHGEFEGETVKDTIETTVGRLLFNEIIPQDLGFVDRSKKENACKLEIDFLVKKKLCKQILEKIISIHGLSKTAEVLDDIKAIGFKYSTLSGITASAFDIIVPKSKETLITEVQNIVDKIARNFRHGLITDDERYKEVIDTWTNTDYLLTKEFFSGLDTYNNIFMMADSEARGSIVQYKQLGGMRGLISDATGLTIELPIKSNFYEGLDVLEYFISTYSDRKKRSNTILHTVNSGYLTRRLVDVSQDLVIRETDCSEGRDIPYMEIKGFSDGKETIETLKERITGRYIAEDIVDPDTGELVMEANRLLTPKMADAVMKIIEKKQPDKSRQTVKIRTILTCRCHNGICSKCYGADMTTGQAVQVGEAVGIIAAQSIGASASQLITRNFHPYGVAGEDISQGLSRIEDLFEAIKPKKSAIISEIKGNVSFLNTFNRVEIIITNKSDSKAYLIPYGSRIKVQDGQLIEAGDELTEGSVNPHDIIKIKGVRAVQDYLLREVQRVYRLQDIEINDKHIEIIVHQMLRKIKVDEAGDTDLLPGIIMDVLEFNMINEALEEDGMVPATGTQFMLGITKASLATDSFLSAASFQETTKVLTEAAINGKIDHLTGLKENVIIGKLIPAGTGMKKYREVKLDTELDMVDEGTYDINETLNAINDTIAEVDNL